MKSNPLSLKKLALIAIPAGIVVGVILYFAIPPMWTRISFDVDLKSPDDLSVSLVLTQPGQPDTTLGTYQGDQSIHFGSVRVLRKDREGIILKAIPSSDQAEATPPAQLDPRNKTLEFVMEWHDISRVYQILVKDAQTARGVPDARVWTSPDSSLAGGRTDSEGNAIFTVRTKPGARFYFYAHKTGYSEGNAEAINQQQGDMATVEISLAPGGGYTRSDDLQLTPARMDVKVLAAYEGTQEVIPGAAVSTVPRELSQSVTTGLGGEADLVVQGNANRQFSIKATFGSDTRTSDPLLLKDGETRSVTIAFPKIHLVEADYYVLVNAGDGMDPSGIQVTANPGGLSAMTDGTGRAAFLGVRLKQGSSLTFSAAPAGGKKKTASINHRPGGGTLQLDLSPNVTTRTCTFRARCGSGTALEGVAISVRDRVTNLVHGKGVTGRDGELQISAAIPAGTSLDYRASAPAHAGLDWTGEKQLSGPVPTSPQSPSIDLVFPCSPSEPPAGVEKIAEIPKDPESSKKTEPAPKNPSPIGNNECSVGDALSRISCLHGLRKFDAALTIEIDKLSGEKLSEAHLYRGYCLDAMGEPKKAVQEFQAVIAEKSARAGLAYLQIGAILMKEGDWAKAIDQFDSALGMSLSDENKGILYYNYGTCRYMQSKFTARPRPLLAAAQEKLNLAQDYLCNEKMGNRYADLCQEIAAGLEDIRNRQSK